MSDGHSILIADDAQSFAVQVARLLTDDEFAAKMSLNARKRVVSDYDWNRIGERLECVLRHSIGLTRRDVMNLSPYSDLVVSGRQIC